MRLQVYVVCLVMAQVSIYLKDDVAETVRASAESENKSVSRFVSDLVTDAVSPSSWPDDFVALLRTGENSLTEPEDPPPEDVAPFE